jgi:uncharacterized protein (DUF2141 family)
MRFDLRSLLFPGLLLAGAAQAHDLTVEVRNVRAGQGTVDGALYAAEANWLKEPLRGERQPAAERTVLVYRELPPGSYALAVFQDINGNGKLDANVAGIPLEPLAFSRDARGRMGPPAFADAVVDLRADTTITVTLQ